MLDLAYHAGGDGGVDLGVFVRTLSSDDVVDLYRVRRLIECAAVSTADADVA